MFHTFSLSILPDHRRYFIILHLALIAHDFLFLSSTSSPAFILGLKVNRRILDSHRLTLSELHGQFTLPFRAVLKAWLITLSHFLLRDTLLAR